MDSNIDNYFGYRGVPGISMSTRVLADPPNRPTLDLVDPRWIRIGNSAISKTVVVFSDWKNTKGTYRISLARQVTKILNILKDKNFKVRSLLE